MFTITIETENPAVLIAIAKAVKNTPPVGFTEVRPGDDVKPPEVSIHTTEAKAEDAKEAVNVNPKATVKVEDPLAAPSPPPAADTAAIGQRVRELLLAVSKMDGQTIQTAKDIAVNAVGGGVAVDKEFPNHPKVQDAIKALEAVANG